MPLLAPAMLTDPAPSGAATVARSTDATPFAWNAPGSAIRPGAESLTRSDCPPPAPVPVTVVAVTAGVVRSSSRSIVGRHRAGFCRGTERANQRARDSGRRPDMTKSFGWWYDNFSRRLAAPACGVMEFTRRPDGDRRKPTEPA